MLGNFLDKSKPINFISLLIFFLFFFLSFSISHFLTDGFTLNNLLYFCLLLVIFLSVFFFFNFIVTRNNLTFDNTYSYFVFTISLIIILPELKSYKILILCILNLLFLRKIYSLHSNKVITSKLFDSGFWLGISFIIEPFTVLFFVLLLAAIYMHQKVTIYTILVPLTGFLAPLMVYFSYLFWNDKTTEFTSLFLPNTNFDISSLTETKYLWFILGILVLSFISVFFKSPKTFSVSNSFRNSWILLLINLFISIIYILFSPENKVAELIFILFPTSVIIANGIELINKKLIKNGVLYLFLASIFIIYFLL
ncbi:DUF6427 family protein [uncultured Polaribacter sp.]|uniref:DUF6427 family protein n=1 Tax=uncultured Polaribacter sp. TaxID=174711 RepID=UPI002639F5D8|nr:DUF6427 family protein [uncultured Polaribacter sp.]